MDQTLADWFFHSRQESMSPSQNAHSAGLHTMRGANERGGKIKHDAIFRRGPGYAGMSGWGMCIGKIGRQKNEQQIRGGGEGSAPPLPCEGCTHRTRRPAPSRCVLFFPVFSELRSRSFCFCTFSSFASFLLYFLARNILAGIPPPHRV